MVVIEASSLEKRFGEFIALKEMSFNVKGDIICVLGPNGSGKTTLLSIVAGLRRPSKGSLRVDGIKPYDERDKAFTDFSFMFERPRFPLSIRVRDVVDVLSDCKFKDLFNELGLKRLSNRKLYELSMGEAQLVGLYVSLCKMARLVILDEPFAHLDVKRASILMDLISAISSKTSVVFTTHSPEEAELLSDSLVVLEDGRLKWSGSVRELFQRGGYEVIVSPKRRNVVEEWLRDAGAKRLYCFGGYCFVYGVEEDMLLNLVKQGLIIGFRAMGVRGYYVGFEA